MRIMRHAENQCGGEQSGASRLHVLLIEDSPDDAEFIVDALCSSEGKPSISFRRIEARNQLSDALVAHKWDSVLCDYRLPTLSAVEALAAVRATQPDVPFIVVSGFVGEEAAVDLIKSGATDFVAKSNLARLPAALERAFAEVTTRRQHQAALAALKESDDRFRNITANLPGMVYQARFPDHARMEMLYVSHGCSLLLGIKPEAVIAQPNLLMQLLTPRDRRSFLRSHLRARRLGVQQNWEGPVTLRDGTAKWINLRASVRAVSDGAMLSEGIVMNITQRKQAQIEVLQSREQLRELSRHFEIAIENQRGNIAREIHDDLGGTLTAAKIDLHRLWQNFNPNDTQLAGLAASVEVLIDNAMDMSRRIARRLRPTVLDHGISAALEWQLRDFGQRTGISCALQTSAQEPDLEPSAATALFRIAQECLTNIAKHAQARKIAVRLMHDWHFVRLRLEDDGRGVLADDLAKAGSFGVRGMRERAAAFGGGFRIAPGMHGGTIVEAWIPVSPRVTQPDSLPT